MLIYYAYSRKNELKKIYKIIGYVNIINIDFNFLSFLVLFNLRRHKLIKLMLSNNINITK